MKSTIETKFLANVISNPNKITGLSKEIEKSDFRDVIYYEIYSKIIQSMIDDKEITYSDLRFEFRNDVIALDVIETIENEELIVSDIQPIYDEMLEQSQKERIKYLSKRILQDCQNGKKSNEILTNIEAEVLNINTSSGIKIITVGNMENEIIKDINYKVKKYRQGNSLSSIIELSTGFDSLDRYTLGFHRKNSWVIGASTSDGKTQMAIQMAVSVINSDKTVMYFMLEDAKENLMDRLISLKTGISIQKIRSGSLSDAELKKHNNTLSSLKYSNKLLIEDNIFEINEIANRIKFAKLKYPDLSLIIIDYIGLVNDRSQRYGNKEQEISSISKKIISLAKSCNVAILSLSQLNTAPDDRGRGMPIRPNDIRDSKASGHDASVVLFIHYPFKNKKTSSGEYSKKYAQLIIAKNRYGETNKIINLINKAHIAKFEEGIPPSLQQDYEEIKNAK